jgi:hypothetical protein
MDNFYQLTSKNINNKIGLIKKYLNNRNHLFSRKYNKIENSIETNKIEAKDINKEKINRINNYQKIIKKRNTGIDLLRIIAMIGIVFAHILYQGKGLDKYQRYNKKIKILFTYIFWHVNTFGIISGIIGYKSTKYSNLLYLWLCAVFYSVSIHYYYLIYKHDFSIKDELYIEYYPIIYKRYWYLTSYFGMFIFLPAINKGIQYLNKSEFKLLVMSILGIFVFWQTYIKNKGDSFNMNVGHSIIWLLCLYIIGAYIGKFNVEYTGIKRNIFSFIYLFIFLLLCSIHNKYRYYIISGLVGNYKIKLVSFIKRLITFEPFCVIKTTQAIFITSFFLQLKYNEYLSKFITFFGPLTFGVYLIHFNRIVRKNYLSKLLNGESYNLEFNEVIKMLILKSLKLFLECIIIEYFRNLLFTILKIRKICMSIEYLAFKIVS